MLEGNGPTLSDIAAVTNGNNNDGFGFGGGWWAWIILIALFGWGGFGGGWGNNNAADRVNDAYVLASDNAALERRIDGVDSEVCATRLDVANMYGTLSQAQAVGNNAIMQAIASQGYEDRLSDQSITQTIANGNTQLGFQIQQGFCDNQNLFMQSQFANQQNNSAVLTAIDKLGDRVIDYMNTNQMQAMRDELNAARLAASQAAQNQYLVNQLRPAAVPAYTVPNPYGYNTSYAGCNCGIA